ncbi:sensor domain-containing diguanylate cyclase [Vogesella sp. LIG4]|uniref:sensor domain-containing diguanylate cyclase n=1 Tax=Vogesella sp. LIG4 TaxID=1192162 RepID=UPI00081F7A57|nr:sensor domain-containing diguanylate cyclase [Vogesella sp. LIG4]SCK18290.1 PAS domain S-box-containing protein/diguanylate cyclase (GGDEF) domain-containing protein [Vogesella sp. LIG4]
MISNMPTPIDQRDSRLRWMDSLITALFLILLWWLVAEILYERASSLNQRQELRQQAWLQQATRSVDTRLDTLKRELQLFGQVDAGLAGQAVSLYPLEGGQLWLLENEQLSQPLGPPQSLSPAARDTLLQLQAQHPDIDKLLLLPASTPDNPDRLQVSMSVCPELKQECSRIITGFVTLTSLLDPELLLPRPYFALLDLQGNRLATRNSAHDNGLLLHTHSEHRSLNTVPLQLSVQFNPREDLRPFMLFALFLVGGAVLLSLLLLLLVVRVNRKLGYAIRHSVEVTQATHLLTLTNNSLRERLLKLVDEQRDQQTLIDTVQVGVLMLDAEQQTLLTVNEAALRMLGYQRQALFRHELEQLFADPAQYRQLLQQLKEQQPVSEREVELITRGEERLWTVLSMRQLLFRERRAIVLSFVDITERLLHAQRLELEKQTTERTLVQLQSTQHELYQRATRDDLTGIANRRHFLSNAGKALEQARREQQPFAVAVLDVDRFKSINDHYGHAVGDSVLRQSAATIVALLPEVALFGRLGGEEFAIALPGFNLLEAHALLDKVRDSLAAQPQLVDEHLLLVTFSAGVAERQLSGDQLSNLLKEADHAMYRAKRNGRNRVESARGDNS